MHGLGPHLLVPAPAPLPEWVIGDTHWGHARLVELAGRPANHDRLMLERWREVVGPADGVLHVGDVCWRREWLDEIAGLSGRVYLVPGNHDQRRSTMDRLAAEGWQIGGPFRFQHCGWDVVVTHRPVASPALRRGRLLTRTLNVHGHVHHKPSPSRRHINVSAEALDYRPARLLELVDIRLIELAADGG